MQQVSEVALIVDPESIYYLNQNDALRTGWFYRDTKTKLDLLGAPYECYHFTDIPAIPDKQRIRLWILPAIFETFQRRTDCRTVPGIPISFQLSRYRILQLLGCEGRSVRRAQSVGVKHCSVISYQLSVISDPPCPLASYRLSVIGHQ